MKFKQKKTKQKWWFPVIVVILVTTAFVRSDFFISRTNNLLLPVKIKIYETSNTFKEFFLTFSRVKEISLENEHLKLSLEKQKYLSLDNQNLLEENKQLRKLLELKEKSKYEIIIAQISYIDSLNPYETISINKGKSQGIEKNMAVTSDYGVIGRIKKVYDDYSTVELITSNKSYTSAIDSNGNSLAILRGEGNEILNLEYVVKATNINVGDKIYTSGISDIYKKNLYLGEVISIDDEDEMFKQIEVELPYNIFNLKNVMIIKNRGEL
jgi:rod shape-determining protein MreC